MNAPKGTRLMRHDQSIYWIVLLLVALFLGPMVVLTKDRGNRGLPSLKSGPGVERIVDAPANVPAAPKAVDGDSSPMPSRPPKTRLPILP